MNKSKVLCFLSNPQILSALIWAVTIIGCSYVADRSTISTILITAAGFHVVLMTRYVQTKPSEAIE